VTKSILGTAVRAGNIGIGWLKSRRVHLSCGCGTSVVDKLVSKYRDQNWDEGWSLIHIIKKTMENYLSIHFLSLGKTFWLCVLFQ